VSRGWRSIDAPHALIGAHAMAARGSPRFTVDIDRTIHEVARHIADVRPDVRPLWHELLQSHQREERERS
jgi:hypothetical protein